jgi:hypothetical protein
VKGTGTLFLLFTLALAGCGKKGAPLPPLLRIPGAVGEAAAMRLGDDVFVRFRVPMINDRRTSAASRSTRLRSIAPRAPRMILTSCANSQRSLQPSKFVCRHRRCPH